MKKTQRPDHYGVADLCRWLDVTDEMLPLIPRTYREFRVPKRSGVPRVLAEPNPMLKELQTRILRRVLENLNVHPAAHGFVTGRSVGSNAAVHVGSKLVLRTDLCDFFPSTGGHKVRRLFRRCGWDVESADWLRRFCCRVVGKPNGLPQGAPTSPKLSNLVSYAMDARLQRLAAKRNAR